MPQVQLIISNPSLSVKRAVTTRVNDEDDQVAGVRAIRSHKVVLMVSPRLKRLSTR